MAKIKAGIITVTAVYGGNSIALLNKIIGLFPDQLLQMGEAVRLFNLYEAGGVILPSVRILLTAYVVLALVLRPAIYWIYQRKYGDMLKRV